MHTSLEKEPLTIRNVLCYCEDHGLFLQLTKDKALLVFAIVISSLIFTLKL